MKTRIKAIQDLVLSLGCNYKVSSYQTGITVQPDIYRLYMRYTFAIYKKDRLVMQLPDSEYMQDSYVNSLTDIDFVDLYNKIESKCKEADDKFREYDSLLYENAFVL